MSKPTLDYKLLSDWIDTCKRELNFLEQLHSKKTEHSVTLNHKNQTLGVCYKRSRYLANESFSQQFLLERAKRLDLSSYLEHSLQGFVISLELAKNERIEKLEKMANTLSPENQAQLEGERDAYQLFLSDFRQHFQMAYSEEEVAKILHP